MLQKENNEALITGIASYRHIGVGEKEIESVKI